MRPGRCKRNSCNPAEGSQVCTRESSEAACCCRGIILQKWDADVDQHLTLQSCLGEQRQPLPLAHGEADMPWNPCLCSCMMVVHK